LELHREHTFKTFSTFSKMLHITIMMYKPGKAAKHVIIICTNTENYLYVHT